MIKNNIKNKFLNKIKPLLQEEHSGAEAMEAMILTPLMYMTFVILLFLFFNVLAYIAYGNVANSIAMELNMRQTGYQTAIDNYPTAPRIFTYMNSNGEASESDYLPASAITVEPNTQALQSATYFALDKYKDHFIIPFNQLTSVKVTTTKAIDTGLNMKLAGTVIKVEIGYTPLTFGEKGHQLFNFKTIGYGVIS